MAGEVQYAEVSVFDKGSQWLESAENVGVWLARVEQLA